MGYLCVKQLSLGGTTFYPGDAIPDGVVFADRAGKLKKNGYIAEVSERTEEFGTGEGLPEGTKRLYTQEDVDDMVAKAVSDAVADMEKKQEELQFAVAELKEMEPGEFEGTVQITVNGKSDGENEQITIVSATKEEIQQVFAIMQLNAEDGAKTIMEVKSENVLILLHAADSRKTVKDAAKKQADNLFPTNGLKNESSTSNATKA